MEEVPVLSRRGPSWLGGRVWLLDLVVVLAIFAYNLPLISIYIRDGELSLTAVILVSAFLCFPYLFRQRYPLAVFGVLLAAAVVQMLLGADLFAADVMLAFAVYNVASRFRWPVSAAAAGAVMVWLVVFIGPRMGEFFLSVGDLGLLIVMVVWVWTWGTLVRIRRNYIDRLAEHARHLELQRQAQARIAAAAERSRIAREMHDIVSHSLSVMVLMSDGAARKAATEPAQAEQAMVHVRDTGRTAMAEMRRMLNVLREGEPGSHTPQPGVGQLDQLVAESRDAGLPVRLSVRGEPAGLDTGVDLAIYRIVQEALTNVRKHAGAVLSDVTVQLSYGAGTVEVEVTDDGQGPNPPNGGAPAGGHGLVGMDERVAAYGGTLQTGARPGGGFRVSAVLPIGGER